jgi:hypothetical protein
METIQVVSMSLLGLILLGLLGIYLYIGLSAGKQDNANEVSKHIAIISGTTGGLLVLFTALSFYYFTANVNYATPYLLIMTGVNSFLSLLAVSVATIQVYQ